MRPVPFRFAHVPLLLALLLASGLCPSEARAQAASEAPRLVDVDGVIAAVPAGWHGEASVSAERGVRRVTFAETATESALRGAALHVEVVPGLNRLQQERWLRGQLLRGLSESYEVEPVAASFLGALEGAAVGFEVGDRAGYALYSRGGPFYALFVEAPAALWADAAAREALLAFARSVRVTR